MNSNDPQQLYRFYRTALTAVVLRQGGEIVLPATDVPPGTLYCKQSEDGSVAFWVVLSSPPVDRADARRRKKLADKYAAEMQQAQQAAPVDGSVN